MMLHHSLVARLVVAKLVVAKLVVARLLAALVPERQLVDSMPQHRPVVDCSMVVMHLGQLGVAENLFRPMLSYYLQGVTLYS